MIRNRFEWTTRYRVSGHERSGCKPCFTAVIGQKKLGAKQRSLWQEVCTKMDDPGEQNVRKEASYLYAATVP